MRLRIGTRGSTLAMQQAQAVLRAAGFDAPRVFGGAQ